MAPKMTVQPTVVDFSVIPFDQAYGLYVSKQSVGLARSFLMELADLNSASTYQIGCFSAGWRIRAGARILIGSTELVDSVQLLDKAVQKIA